MVVNDSYHIKRQICHHLCTDLHLTTHRKCSDDGESTNYTLPHFYLFHSHPLQLGSHKVSLTVFLLTATFMTDVRHIHDIHLSTNQIAAFLRTAQWSRYLVGDESMCLLNFPAKAPWLKHHHLLPVSTPASVCTKWILYGNCQNISPINTTTREVKINAEFQLVAIYLSQRQMGVRLGK